MTDLEKRDFLRTARRVRDFLMSVTEIDPETLSHFNNGLSKLVAAWNQAREPGLPPFDYLLTRDTYSRPEAEGGLGEVSYILQRTEGSICPTCSDRPKLLTRKSAQASGPSFYICFRCGFVGEVGRGQVSKGKAPAGRVQPP